MSQREYTERVATYLTPEQHTKLRESAYSNRVSIAAEIRNNIVDRQELAMTNTETHLSMAMSHLRKVSTSKILGENKERLQDYVDAIETELERIKKERGLR